MNKWRLKEKISENGYTQRSLAKLVDMSENTLTSRLNGHSSFNTKEICLICEKLNISDAQEKVDIFL